MIYSYEKALQICKERNLEIRFYPKLLNFVLENDEDLSDMEKDILEMFRIKIRLVFAEEQLEIYDLLEEIERRVDAK